MTAVDDFLTEAGSDPASPDETYLLALADNHPSPRPEPDRDRWGRYKLRHPDTGKAQGWTRATTLARTLADEFHLSLWKQRQVALGLSQRRDLLDRIAAFADDKDAVNDLVNQAQEAAGANIAARLGTAMHTLTEHHDLGTPVDVPAPWDSDIAAYAATLDGAGITRPVDWIERIVLVPELGIAGTLDRIVTHPDWELPRILDLKTGRDLSYARLEISIQLALYANATHMWDHDTGAYQPMPEVDRRTALVAHVPVGQGVCTLLEVDIVKGWQMAKAAKLVRDWRKNDKALFRTATVRAAAPTRIVDTLPEAVADLAINAAAPVDRTAWIKDRLAVLAVDERAKAAVKRTWPAGCPGAGPWTDDQVDELDRVLAAVERLAGAPFPEPDPAAPAPTRHPLDTLPARPSTRPDVDPGPEGAPVDRHTFDLLRSVVTTLPEPALDEVKMWLRDAKREGVPFDGDATGLSDRRWRIGRAAHLCAAHLLRPDRDDQLIRFLLAYALDIPVLEPQWQTGVVFGCLSGDHADFVAQIAEAAASDPFVAADLAGRAPAAPAA